VLIFKMFRSRSIFSRCRSGVGVKNFRLLTPLAPLSSRFEAWRASYR